MQFVRHTFPGKSKPGLRAMRPARIPSDARPPALVDDARRNGSTHSLLGCWATWCGPCRAEFPHYRDLVDSYASADDVVFLAITTDVDHSESRTFLEENDYRFTVLFDQGSAVDFQVTGIPAHFILVPGGRIQYATSGFPGAERYAEEMRLRIEALRPREGAPGGAS